MNKALEGLRIVDLTMGWAGPLATRNLADMGAQVIKVVESCERFDWWRSWRPPKHGLPMTARKSHLNIFR